MAEPHIEHSIDPLELFRHVTDTASEAYVQNQAADPTLEERIMRRLCEENPQFVIAALKHATQFERQGRGPSETFMAGIRYLIGSFEQQLSAQAVSELESLFAEDSMSTISPSPTPTETQVA